MTETIMRKKVCLLGSYGVGKTSLVRRFVHQKFEEKYLSTLGVNISKKKVHLNSCGNNKIEEMELIIWDIANIEKFDNMVKNYLKGAQGAIIVTDVTRPNTVEHGKNLSKKFLLLNNDANYIFVGNKTDLIEGPRPTPSEYLMETDNDDIRLFFSSAKTGENIEEIFSSLASQIFENESSE